MSKSRPIIQGLLALLLLGCAGSGGSSGSQVKTYSADLGVSSVLSVQDQTQRILVNKYQFVLRYVDQSNNRLYIETDWKERLPFEDEQLGGIRQVRSRIILEARSRTYTGESSTMTVRFKGENQLLFADTGNWERGYITKEGTAYFKEIANELKSQFAMTTREY